MPDRAPRLGDVIDDYCPRCRLLLNHDVTSLFDDQVGQGHLPDLPQHARLPPRPGPAEAQASKKDDKQSLMEQVLASMPKPPEPPPAAARRARPQEAGPVGRGRADQGQKKGLACGRSTSSSSKRDGGELTREEIDFFIRGYARGDVPDYQASALAMAVFFRGHDARRDLGPHRVDDAHGRGARPLRPARAPRPTSTRRAASATRRAWSSAPLAAACGVYVPMISGRGPRPHRRHPRQARVDPRLPTCGLSLAEFRAVLARVRPRPHRPDPGDRPRRPQALRAARRDRDRREPAPDLRLDHEQEDGGGHRRPGPRRQVRRRRLPALARGGRGPGPDHARHRPGHGQEGRRPPHRHGPAAGPRRAATRSRWRSASRP